MFSKDHAVNCRQLFFFVVNASSYSSDIFLIKFQKNTI